MTRTTPRRPSLAALVTAALVNAALPCATASASPEVTLETAQDALVDLDTLWTKATGGKALDPRYVDSYLTSAAAPIIASGTRAPQALFDVGFALDLEPLPDLRTPVAAARLPVVPVTPDDARVLYRRQAYLSIYLRKHAAVTEVLSSGKVARSAQMPPEAILRHNRQAAAAHVELFLIERVALGEGETQEQKCAAYQRAVTHARALGLEAARSGAAATPVSEAELPSDWGPLLASARRQHADQHARFPAALCEVGAVVTRTQTRVALEKLLATRLEQRVTSYFTRRAEELKTVQGAFSQLAKDTATPVPRRDIVEMRKRLIDAQSAYQQIIVDDMFKLNDRLSALEAKAKALQDLLGGGQTARGTFAVPEAELARLRGELSKFTALASAIGGIRFPGASERAAVAACARVPATFTPSTSASSDLPAMIDACLTAAQALRDRLIRTPNVPADRDAFLRHLQNLSAVYLAVNSW